MFTVLQRDLLVFTSKVKSGEAEPIETVEVVEPDEFTSSLFGIHFNWWSHNGNCRYCACCKRSEDGYARIQ